MKKDEKILLKITKTDKAKVKEMREDYDVNISAFLRESIRKKYKELKRKGNDSI